MTDGTDLVPVETVEAVQLGTLRANNPAAFLAAASAIATPLAGLIEKQKLYSVISGRRYVRCEGWTTLAAMLGSTPHEVEVVENEGSFTATVELRRLSDGVAVARASAECGMDEPTWKGRARYARRSMALTRATAKAARLAFSWVMVLAGFEGTPAEEIPEPEKPAKARKRPEWVNEAGEIILPKSRRHWPEHSGKVLKDVPESALVTALDHLRQNAPEPYAPLIEALEQELERRRPETTETLADMPAALKNQPDELPFK